MNVKIEATPVLLNEARRILTFYRQQTSVDNAHNIVSMLQQGRKGTIMYEIETQEELETIIGKAFLSGFELGHEDGFVRGHDIGAKCGYEMCETDYGLTKDELEFFEEDKNDEE